MTEPAPERKISARYYQVLCGLALVMIFLLQVQQNISPFLNAAMLCVGALTTLTRFRLSPIWVFLVIAVSHLIEQHQSNQLINPDFRTFRFLDLNDMLLCMAVLTYTIAQYRLHALRFHLEIGRASPRSEDSLSMRELLALILPIPLCTLAAEWMAVLLRQHWELVGLPPRWKQLLALSWALLVVLFLAAHGFAYWRRVQMARGLALQMLQDVLWNETRREQRRIARWLAWVRLKG